MIRPLSPVELAQWRGDPRRAPPLVVDVREPWEYHLCRIAGSHHVPLSQLPSALGQWQRDRDIVLVCHHGARSMHAGMFLVRSGFPRVHNLSGGIAAWANDVEPAMPRY